MKKANLLCKSEMKKVMGGDDPQSMCVPTVYCMADGILLDKIEVGDCDAQAISAVCHHTGSGPGSYCQPC